MSTHALYHQSSTQSVRLAIIGKAKGDKVDLGRDKQVLVAGVPIAETGEPGTCTLVDESKAAQKTESGKDETEPQKPASGKDEAGKDEGESAALDLKS